MYLLSVLKKEQILSNDKGVDLGSTTFVKRKFTVPHKKFKV